MSLPFNETKALIFTGWLLERGVSHATISKYLSGVRQLHLIAGHQDFSIRSDLTKQILTGRKNQGTVEETIGEKGSRIPVTPNLMLLIKRDLAESPMDKARKLLLWSVSTLLFNGGFRVGEILPSNKRTFDPYSTLLEKDVEIKKLTVNQEVIETLQIKLKSEKTNRNGKATIVDVYESNGQLCPLRAFNKWRKGNALTRALPLFKDDSGSPFTDREFNSYLREFSSRHLKLEKRSLSSHSFRAGMTTLLAELGYTDEEIMSWGRWNSRSFEAYIKAPRTRRLEMARQIAKIT